MRRRWEAERAERERLQEGWMAAERVLVRAGEVTFGARVKGADLRNVAGDGYLCLAPEGWDEHDYLWVSTRYCLRPDPEGERDAQG